MSSGLFLGSVLATKVSWLDTTLTPVNGKLMTLVFVGNMIGMCTHMSLLGYLFDHVTPMWFVYLLAHTILLLLTFMGLVAVTKYFTNVYCRDSNLETEATDAVHTKSRRKIFKDYCSENEKLLNGSCVVDRK